MRLWQMSLITSYKNNPINAIAPSSVLRTCRRAADEWHMSEHTKPAQRDAGGPAGCQFPLRQRQIRAGDERANPGVNLTCESCSSELRRSPSAIQLCHWRSGMPGRSEQEGVGRERRESCCIGTFAASQQLHLMNLSILEFLVQRSMCHQCLQSLAIDRDRAARRRS